MPQLTGIQKVIGVSALVVAGGGIGGYIATQQETPPAEVQSANRYCANTAGECRILRELMGEKECPSGWYEVPSCTDSGTVEVPTPTPTPYIQSATPTPVPTPPPASPPPIMLAMPPQGYVLRLECEFNKCVGNLGMGTDQGPAWQLEGPWLVKVIPVPTP